MQRENELTSIEGDILIAARENGLIHFPQGRIHEVEKAFKILKDLSRRGYLEYVDKTGYRAFWLTQKGVRFVSALRAIRNTTLVQAA